MLASAGQASAADITTLCPPEEDTLPGQTRQYSITIDSVTGATCLAYGDGNLNGKNSDAFLDFDDPDGAWKDWAFVGQNSVFSSTGSLTKGTSGDWTILASIFDPLAIYAIGLKDGGVPKWALFELPTGVSTGFWGIVSDEGELSHLALYRKLGPDEDPQDPIPEPTTLALLGLGLIVAGARLRRSRHARS